MVVISEPRPMVAQLIAQAKGADEPVILTTNGEPELVLLTPAMYQALLDRVDHWETIASLYKTEAQCDRGEAKPAREFFEEFSRD